MCLSLKQQRSLLIKRQLEAARRLAERFPRRTHKMHDDMTWKPRGLTYGQKLTAAIVKRAREAGKKKGGLVRLAKTTGFTYAALWRAAHRGRA